MSLRLSFWIYVIYSILYKLSVSTISLKPVKNYHTIAPSMYCCNFEIISNLGMDVLFIDSRDFIGINHCIVDKVCWITAYAAALITIMLASLNKLGSISLIFSWTLVIGLGISTYDGKTFSYFNHVCVISGGSSSSQSILSSPFYEKHLLLLVCTEI